MPRSRFVIGNKWTRMQLVSLPWIQCYLGAEMSQFTSNESEGFRSELDFFDRSSINLYSLRYSLFDRILRNW